MFPWSLQTLKLRKADLEIPMVKTWQHQHHWVSALPAYNGFSGCAILCLPPVDTGKLAGKQ